MECWIEWPLETLISVTGPPGPATHVTGIINIAIHITHHHHWRHLRTVDFYLIMKHQNIAHLLNHTQFQVLTHW